MSLDSRPPGPLSPLPAIAPLPAAEPAAARRGAALRRQVREGRISGHTSGLAADLVQGNLVVLPAAEAAGFDAFCRANPAPCPVLARSAPGDFRLPALGEDLDLRTDIPRYRVWRDGALVEERRDIAALWQPDFVAFVLGCSFSFEWALLEAGIPLKHVAQGRNVGMWRTNRLAVPAGGFGGPVVVSMRPIPARLVERAAAITARFPRVHGAPLHAGDPSALGIDDPTLQHPHEGDAVPLAPGEVPMFHACGVTPQAALAAARPALCITHSPGAMLITDLRNAQLEGLPAA
jgi:uncharacterized protein YcsI (UPF0317 family)